MTRSAPRPAIKKQALEHLQDVEVHAESGLHIGHIVVDGQPLRVGIRPAPAVGRGAPKATPLLLFNGIGANMELAGLLIAQLGSVETIIFDVPGAGKSPPPKYPYRMCSMAALALRLLDRLGYAQVDVMGVSWGGGLAQQFAIQYPKRVRRLILAATAMGAPAMVPGRLSVLLKMVNPRRYLDKQYMEGLAPTLYGGQLRSNPQAIKLFTAHVRGGSKQGYRYQMLAMMGWTSLPWLWRIQHPTLVMAGNDDPLVPLINARMHAWLLPDAQLHILEDGHLFLLTQAERTASIISEFLA